MKGELALQKTMSTEIEVMLLQYCEQVRIQGKPAANVALQARFVDQAIALVKRQSLQFAIEPL